MSYLRYLCLFSYSGIDTYCVVFLLYLSSSCVCCQFFLIVLFWLPLQYSFSLFTVQGDIYSIKTEVIKLVTSGK